MASSSNSLASIPPIIRLISLQILSRTSILSENIKMNFVKGELPNFIGTRSTCSVFSIWQYLRYLNEYINYDVYSSLVHTSVAHGKSSLLQVSMYLGVHTTIRSLNFKPYGVILILREGNNSICIVLTAC